MIKQLGFLWGLLVLTACSLQQEKAKILLVYGEADSVQQHSTENLISKIGAKSLQEDYNLDTLSNLAGLNEELLQQYSALILWEDQGGQTDYRQEKDVERFVQAGGGIIGLNLQPIRAPYQWVWFNKMLDAHHPEKNEEPIISNSRTPAQLASLESPLNDRGGAVEFTQYGYDGGQIARLYLSNEAGKESLEENLAGSIKYAIGDGHTFYKNATAKKVPDDNRFVKKVLDDDLYEPMELDVMPDGRVIFMERRGKVKLFEPEKEATKLLARFDVSITGNYEDGMLGLALDPDFSRNGRLYIYYSPAGPDSVNRLSRFLLAEDSLIRSSEKVMLEVPVQRETCCHTGGSIVFGPDGNLYLSTGDNTSSKESSGYTPIDERPGRGPYDAQKSSGNTNDLRGKILRITPQPDGSYTIPEGNMFPKNDSLTQPEIYVMGVRNPFRFSIDPKTNYLYWGDVGPDAGESSIQGPQSYDEWNQAREPGFFGWPYFEGDNIAYPDWDFTNDTRGPKFDPENPVNDSPNNTGRKHLPPARKPLIWYPYGKSEMFPELGTGSRSAMGGPFYYSEHYKNSNVKFPGYYDGKFFIYEWARSWVKVVTLDEQENLLDIEPFLPEEEFVKPIDIEFGPEGAMYMLEYGADYFANNKKARLVKIEYTEGNRGPVAKIDADPVIGGIPLEVHFDASASFDHDTGDSLQFNWYFTSKDKVQETGKNPVFTFENPGIYHPKLEVVDNAGAIGTTTMTIKAGNAPPEITLNVSGNQSFYYEGQTLPYKVEVNDKEDGSLSDGGIATEQLRLSFDYLANREDVALLRESQGQGATPVKYLAGKKLISDSDCQSCHSMAVESRGPSYQAIASRYKGDQGAGEFLAEKIIKGGSGNWGQTVMAAHPQHSMEEAQKMAGYILSLEEDASSMGAQGTLSFNQHRGEQGAYVLSASYRDQGGNQTDPIKAREIMELRHPRIQVEHAKLYKDVGRNMPRKTDLGYISSRGAGGYIALKNLDVSALKKIVCHAASGNDGGIIELRLDGFQGPLLGTARIDNTGGREQFQNFDMDLQPAEGFHDLYFVFKPKTGSEDFQVNLDWVYFQASTGNPDL